MSRRKKTKRSEKSGPRRNGRLRDARSRLRWTAVLGAVALVFAALVAGLLLSNAASGGGPPPSKTAAIIDQLSLTVPNRDFRKSATETLQQAGYGVDYYSGEEITVDFYRDLPLRGYDLLVLRVHAGITRDKISHALKPEDGAGLFTNEPYDPTEYHREQTQGELINAFYTDDGPKYFGITPAFVESSMRGRFNGALVILMGCDGLTTTRTAEAFLRMGASNFVSWTDSVYASHADIATERLLVHLQQGTALTEAVEMTAAEVGPDPDSGAELRVVTSGG